MVKRKRGGVVLGVLGAVLILGGGALLAGVALAPEQVEKGYGDIKVAIGSSVDKVQEEVFEELPTVTVGVEGGIPELDLCDGTFTIMTSYERDGVPETAAAHNNCGGDVLLPWEEGQRIRIDGRDEVYEVVDIRYTSKIWSSTDDLVGLQGEIALQSCFYGEDRMKFVGLEPVDDA
ncbi:hypothetical protein [Microbacterium karelineae]|uniref:hypothetical protein n=1 Tax=Microbacterium karelineae TaxID=2654283 RepID=UPI0012EA9450|nr:hypothetical protein [Microbacterium karelineae]